MIIASGILNIINPSKNIVTKSLTPIIVMLFSCHSVIGGLLCCIISFIITKMLSTLTQRVRKITIRDREEKLTLKLVSQWQRVYHLIDGLIREMNSCFGFNLLVIVFFNFVWLVNGSFVTVLELKELGLLRFNTLVMDLLLLIVSLLITFIISVLHGFKLEVLGLFYVKSLMYGCRNDKYVFIFNKGAEFCIPSTFFEY